jgi:NADP-reducing hydrogenase subunit HndB
MKTPEDLKALRERAQAALAVRKEEEQARVVVAMGTCGIAAGAREVMAAMMEELAERGLYQVKIAQTACKGLCDKEPMVEVHLPGKPAVTYANVTPAAARRLIAEHVVNGQIVADYALATEGSE